MSMVSVVLPCYNDVEDVGEGLDSVLGQTAFDRIRQVIVVDDGSTDGTGALVRGYEANHEEIEYVCQENQGPGAARNAGIRRSSGEYIAFLDADDLWLPRKIEKQLDFLDAHRKVGLVFTDYYIVELDGKRRQVRSNHFDFRCDDSLERYFAYDGPIIVPSVIVRSECFDRVGLFDTDLPKGQDTDMWLRVAAEYPIQRIAEPLVLRRRRQDSVSSAFEEKYRYLHRVVDKTLARHPELQSLAHIRRARIERSLGMKFLLAGEWWRGLKCIIRALKENPTEGRTYAALLLGLLPVGKGALRSVVKLGRWARSRFSGWPRDAG